MDFPSLSLMFELVQQALAYKATHSIGFMEACGIFGAFGSSLNQAERNNVIQLGILSQFRGMDSTGIGVISRKYGAGDKIVAKTYKNAVDSTGFFLESKTRDIMSGGTNASPYAIIGHCRAATAGDVNVTNAHPYIVDNHVVGVHNGTIFRFRPPKALEATRTDSLELYERVSRKGLAEALADADTGAAFALAWYDTRTGRINFIRNEQRPLYFLRGTAGTIYFASEYRMLDFMASDRDSGISYTNVSGPEITSLEVDHLYSFNVLRSVDYTKTYIPYKKMIEDNKEAAFGTLVKLEEKKEADHAGVRNRPFLKRGIEEEPKEREVEGATKEKKVEVAEDGVIPFRTCKNSTGEESPPTLRLPGPASASTSVPTVLPQPNGSGTVAPLPPLRKTLSIRSNSDVSLTALARNKVVEQGVAAGRSKIREFTPAGYSGSRNKRKAYMPTYMDPIAGIPVSLLFYEKSNARKVLFTDPSTVQYADRVFPDANLATSSSPYPNMIVNDKDVYKRLYYYGPGRMFVPASNQKLEEVLSFGCLLTGVVPKTHDPVRWISQNEFVMEEAFKDPYLKAYYTKDTISSQTVKSCLVYATDEYARTSNIAANKSVGH